MASKSKHGSVGLWVSLVVRARLLGCRFNRCAGCCWEGLRGKSSRAMPFLRYAWYVAGFRTSFWFSVSFPRASQASDRREGVGFLQAGLCPTTAVDFACRPGFQTRFGLRVERVVLYDLGSIFVPGTRTLSVHQASPKSTLLFSLWGVCKPPCHGGRAGVCVVQRRRERSQQHHAAEAGREQQMWASLVSIES